MLIKSKINGHCMGYDLHIDEEVELPEEVVEALGNDVEQIKGKKEVKGAKNTALDSEEVKTKSEEKEEKEQVNG